MVILALDTTTPTGSVALIRDGTLCGCHTGDSSRTHGERLPGDITALLAAHRLTMADVELYGVCSGPGSFTGLRVGLGTIQALALVNERKVVAVPTLEAVAFAALRARSDSDHPELVGAWMNAHRGEVFAALYENPTSDPSGDPVHDSTWQPLVEVVGPMAATAAVVLREWRGRLSGRRVEIIGDAVGASRQCFDQELDPNLGGAVHLVTDVPPLAPIIAYVAEAVARRHGGVSPHAVRPVYVRRPDVELARERKLGAKPEPRNE